MNDLAKSYYNSTRGETAEGAIMPPHWDTIDPAVQAAFNKVVTYLQTDGITTAQKLEASSVQLNNTLAFLSNLMKQFGISPKPDSTYTLDDCVAAITSFCAVVSKSADNQN